MANPPPSSDSSKKSRSLREALDVNNGRPPAARGATAKDPWLDSAAPAGEAVMNATSDEEHEEILRRLRQQAEAPSPRGEERAPARSGPVRSAPAEEERGRSGPSKAAGGVDADKLLDENERLRGIIADLKQELDEAVAKGAAAGSAPASGPSFEEREREYELLLEEKSENIRELHIRAQELEKQLAEGGGGGGGSAKGETPAADHSELLALSDELERERTQLEQERKNMEEDRAQLHEDEESMMRQMREMELQMAKERAELARQRNELQRLHTEIRHELELATRDAALNERLKLLQRRHNEAVNGPGPSSGSASGAEKKEKPEQAPQKKDSGSFVWRLFGKDNK